MASVVSQEKETKGFAGAEAVPTEIAANPWVTWLKGDWGWSRIPRPSRRSAAVYLGVDAFRAGTSG